jgi:hypothetical protein
MSQEPRGRRFANEWAGGEPALSRVLWLIFLPHPIFSDSSTTQLQPLHPHFTDSSLHVKMAKTKSGDNISSRLALVMKSGKG